MFLVANLAPYNVSLMISLGANLAALKSCLFNNKFEENYAPNF
jgi:hypothetical protein